MNHCAIVFTFNSIHLLEIANGQDQKSGWPPRNPILSIGFGTSPIPIATFQEGIQSRVSLHTEEGRNCRFGIGFTTQQFQINEADREREFPATTTRTNVQTVSVSSSASQIQLSWNRTPGSVLSGWPGLFPVVFPYPCRFPFR